MEWWNSVTLETPEEEITWKQFQVKFETKFISTSQKFSLFKMFVEMKQNGHYMLDYVSDFEALSRYARSYIDTPYQKNEKFFTDLDTYIGRPLVEHLDDSFEKIMEKSVCHEILFPKEENVVVATKEVQKPRQGGNNKKRKQKQQEQKKRKRWPEEA